MSSINQSDEQLDAIFMALSHMKRRGILTTLAFRPTSVSQLAKEFTLSLPAIYKHLRLMEEAQLIQRKKAGRTNFVALSRPTLQLAKNWLNQYHTEWGSDGETLENYLTTLTRKN